MHCLTTAHYYRASGLDMHQRQTRRRLEGIAAVLHEYGESQVATAKKDSFLNGRVAAYATNSDALWAALGKRSWAKRRLHLYGAKKRVLDKFVQSLVPTRRDAPGHRWLGAADPRVGGRGSADTGPKLTALSQKLPTIFVDEMNSTKMCVDCGFNVEDMRERKDASWCRRRRRRRRGNLCGNLRGPRRALLSRVRETRTRHKAPRHERGEEHRGVPP